MASIDVEGGIQIHSEPRNVAIEAFWGCSSSLGSLKESERLEQNRSGMPAELVQALRVTFDLQDSDGEFLLSGVTSTRRRRRCQKTLNSIASERLDRIGMIYHLAAQVFENQAGAAHWMYQPNKVLDGSAPIMRCSTDIGGHQVRRALHALEWGGGT